jgi:hypothetical protein
VGREPAAFSFAAGRASGHAVCWGIPLSVLTTLKSLSMYTVTGVPSAFVMCASYSALPSASVSTRMTVPPGTSASAAAVTFDAVSPVSSVSSLR